MYGRLRYAADVLAGHCDRFIGITSLTRLVRQICPNSPRDEKCRSPRIGPDYGRGCPDERGFAIAETERRVLTHHASDDYAATILRYTNLYGPRVTRQWLWPLVRRVVDGRQSVIVPGDGAAVPSICFIANAAQQVLLAIDRPEAVGQIFNSIDQYTYVLSDIIRLVGEGWTIHGTSCP